MISETVTNSLTGSKPSFTPTVVGGGTYGPGSTKKSGSGSPETYGCRTGIVTVVDVQNVVDPQVGLIVYVWSSVHVQRNNLKLIIHRMKFKFLQVT